MKKNNCDSLLVLSNAISEIPHKNYNDLLNLLISFNFEKFKEEHDNDFEYDHKFINSLFSAVIQTLKSYQTYIRSNFQLQLVQYSLFKYISDKFCRVLMPVFELEFAPKYYKKSFYIKIKFKKLIKYYCYLCSNNGFVEISKTEFDDILSKVRDNSNQLEYIPLKEMEF